MKYAPVSWPDVPPGGVSAGIDWASADHAVCVVDAAGQVAVRFSVVHTAAGLRVLVQRLARAGGLRWRSSVAMGRWWTPCWRRG
jgi:transposase